jgi:HEXXH motif-containing protein
LLEVQLSRRKLDLLALSNAVAERTLDFELPISWNGMLAYLSSADRIDAPEVNDLLLEPAIGSWTRFCLRNLDELRIDDLAYLGNIVAVASMRTGLGFRVTASVSDGLVYLPTLGSLRVADCATNGLAFLSSDGDWLSIEFNGSAVPLPTNFALENDYWRPLRRIVSTASGPQLNLTLDDLDPYRKSFGFNVLERQPLEVFEQWHSVIIEGWTSLVAHHSEFAEIMSMGLRTIVPLRLDGPTYGSSATVNDALGAIFTHLPSTPLRAAHCLVHEFQHNRFGFALEQLELSDEGSDELFYAPWRNDPRPLLPLLNGAYAHLAIVEFWGVQRQCLDEPTRSYAESEFARWRHQVDRALQSAKGAQHLTDEGRSFVESMQSALRRWLDETVGDEFQRLAVDAAVFHEARWRLENMHPDAEQLEGMVEAWNAGRSCEQEPRSAVMVGERICREERMELLRYSRLTGAPFPLDQPASAIESALMEARYDFAADELDQLFALGRADTAHWAAFAVALFHVQNLSPARMKPEWLHSLLGKIEDRQSPTPRALSNWLTAGGGDRPPTAVVVTT